LEDLSSFGPSDTLLIASPTRNYTLEESNSVASFLKSGGKVVVMDDFGNANSLLEGIGSPITINATPLCEYEYYHVNHTFPIISYLNPSDDMANVSSIILNHPASLDVSPGAYELAQTSGRGWLDINDNSRIDGREKMGRFVVIAKANIDNGQLIVISDPDVFINSMIDLGDNQIFMGNIFNGNVWIDVGHGRSLTLFGAVYYTVKYDVKAQAALIMLLVLSGYAYIQRRDILVISEGSSRRGRVTDSSS
jgi:hypothetical protein